MDVGDRGESGHGSLGGLTPSAFFEREEEDKKEAA
jgi:hypothetical protein